MSDRSASYRKTRLAAMAFWCVVGMFMAAFWRHSATWADDMLIEEPLTFRQKQIAWEIKHECLVSFRPILAMDAIQIPLAVQGWPFEEDVTMAFKCKRFRKGESNALQWVVVTKDHRVNVDAARPQVEALAKEVIWGGEETFAAGNDENHTACRGDTHISWRGRLPATSFSDIAGQLIELPEESFQRLLQDGEQRAESAEDLATQWAALQVSSTFLFSTDGQLKGESGGCSLTAEKGSRLAFEAVRCQTVGFVATASYFDDTNGPPAEDKATGRPIYRPWHGFGPKDFKDEAEAVNPSAGLTADVVGKLGDSLLPYYRGGVLQEEKWQLDVTRTTKGGEVPDGRALESITGLSGVVLRGPGISDAALLQFARFEGYAGELVIDDCPVSDAGIAHIASMPKLRKIGIIELPDPEQPGGMVTEKGIRLLRRIPALETVLLDGEYVNDGIVAELAECPAIRNVALRGKNLSPTGLRSLVKNQNVARIALPSDRDDLADFFQSRPGWTRVSAEGVTIWRKNSGGSG